MASSKAAATRASNYAGPPIFLRLRHVGLRVESFPKLATKHPLRFRALDKLMEPWQIRPFRLILVEVRLVPEKMRCGAPHQLWNGDTSPTKMFGIFGGAQRGLSKQVRKTRKRLLQSASRYGLPQKPLRSPFTALFFPSLCSSLGIERGPKDLARSTVSKYQRRLASIPRKTRTLAARTAA